MEYLKEFRANLRPLAAAAAGMGGGPALMNYSLAVFAPYLIGEFGWSQGDFALVGTVGLFILFFVPIFGRMADLVGVRRTALIGVIGVPACLVAFSFQGGGFTQFFIIYVIGNILGSAATTAVYTRLVASRFKKARGLALAIVIAAPAAVVTVALPVLRIIIDGQGWRVGYVTLAVFLLVVGVIALILVPPRGQEPRRQGGMSVRATAQDYKLILTSMPFWLVFVGMFLCNIPAGLQQSQLILVMQEKGLTVITATGIFASYTGFTILGRFITGLSLDRFPPHIVAGIAMGVPAIGFLMLVSGVSSTAAIAVSIIIMGLSQGAEGDLMGYLTARYFKIELYSSTLGLVYGAVGSASAVGAIILSQMYGISESYMAFLWLSGFGVVFGSVAFFMLGYVPVPRFAAPAGAGPHLAAPPDRSDG